VEGIQQRDGLELLRTDLAAVRADDLQRAFDGLGAGVAKEHAIEAAGLGYSLRERPLILVIVQIRAVDHPGSLLANHLHQPRMRVPQRVDADPRDQIQVALARSVIDVAALAASQHQRVSQVVLKQILLFEIDDRGRPDGRGDSGVHCFIINW